MSRMACSSNNDCKKGNGNCSYSGSDNLPVQCVGSWVEDKYYYLDRYLKSSEQARKAFTDKGNAVYIDLFCGPGICRIKDKQKEIRSGCARAYEQGVIFNEFYLVDLEKENIEAVSKRLQGKLSVKVFHGDANAEVINIVRVLNANAYRYHFAYLDPFGPEALKFSTIKELAKMKRMDLLIHFPIGAIRRNIETWLAKSEETILDSFLGTTEWRSRVIDLKGGSISPVLLDIYKAQLKAIGYPDDGLEILDSENNLSMGMKTATIKNTKEVDLYYLIFAAKHPLGQKIWSSASKIDTKGQRELF